MVADMELKFIKDRQKGGHRGGKADGAYKGRKKRVNDDEIRRLPHWRQQGQDRP